jgi:hypothetical protein
MNSQAQAKWKLLELRLLAATLFNVIESFASNLIDVLAPTCVVSAMTAAKFVNNATLN